MARRDAQTTDAEPTGAHAVGQAARPRELAGVDYTPENYRRIAIVHMLHGLDMLRGLALDPKAAIKVRKEAMAVLVEAGTAALGKAGRPGSETDDSGMLQRLAEALASSDPDALDAALRSTSPPLPLPTPPAPLAGDQWDPEILKDPPTPEEPLPIEPTPRRTIECKPQTTTERILFVLRREGPIERRRLRNFLRTNGFRIPEDWDEAIQDLMSRGLVFRAPINGKGPSLYQLTGMSLAREEA